MKIRAGFVSNSSSSSFCLFGIQLNQAVFNTFPVSKKKKIEKLEDDCIDATEYLEELCDKGGLSVERNEYGMYYVGFRFADMEDGETKQGLKERVVAAITKCLGASEDVVRAAYGMHIDSKEY